MKSPSRQNNFDQRSKHEEGMAMNCQ